MPGSSGQAGDHGARALEELLANEIPRLEAFLRARVGGIVAARESVRDIAQSICREALPDLKGAGLEDEVQLRRWLFARAIRKVCNRYRYHNRECRSPDRELATPESEGEAQALLEAYATVGTPSRNASAREELCRFEAALLRLNDEQREAIALTRVAGLSPREAGEQMQRSESAVRGLVHRGLTALSGYLDQQGADE